MPGLRPFLDYSEHDVCNLFSYSGAIPAYRGTVLTFVASGWRTDETNTNILGSVGASYANTVSTRWGTLPALQTASTGTSVAGIMLWDVREVDENGEPLRYNPRKAAEMQVALSGQSVPVLTKGFVLISGVLNGGVTAGQLAYPSGAGEITTNSVNVPDESSIVGKFFGRIDTYGYALLHVNCV